jgi:hypothetical protein
MIFNYFIWKFRKNTYCPKVLKIKVKECIFVPKHFTKIAYILNKISKIHFTKIHYQNILQTFYKNSLYSEQNFQNSILLENAADK